MKIAYNSVIGKVRDKNEDAVGTFKNQQGVVLALLSDGIGGNKAGEVASQLVVTNLGNNFANTDLASIKAAQAWLDRELNKVNDVILTESHTDMNLKGMGTTFVAALVAGEDGFIANIGDSRGYLFSNNHLQQVSEDHSYVNELIKTGNLTPDEAKNNPYKNIITKSLGINDASTADYMGFQLQDQDQILLCSDGLTNMVDDQTIAEVLGEPLSVKEKCEKLITLANDKGGLDNITVLIMNYESAGDVDE
ncbi:Stp1/IreP family PP2C-type Ser/Thr phosphatase [Lentilactobacillus kosonis]|uniref:Protein serine/threonine phosphatase PrpC, regulation of stationary phase n=1 Tax=Lentilactobacillus kosonis TaxID=2810561 RepID=A0A401FL48_9LACO|nr:Stp1/IreP family PP2C-type Ser/Thr phosphatase [Lentilactobacillus kosonis]GAY72931.1 protein serine/threonine phosphatase PrpC, regulation of stationary phase [Lentilactobacillus kosonis]